MPRLADHGRDIASESTLYRLLHQAGQMRYRRLERTPQKRTTSGLLQNICARQGIVTVQLVVHSDNGSPMKGETMLATMQRLGVAPSPSRPSVSNDNPYSESLFRTLKHRPELPVNPFENLLQARRWATALVRWYNDEHHHSAIGFVTRSQRHAGQDMALLESRAALYDMA